MPLSAGSSCQLRHGLTQTVQCFHLPLYMLRTFFCECHDCFPVVVKHIMVGMTVSARPKPAQCSVVQCYPSQTDAGHNLIQVQLESLEISLYISEMSYECLQGPNRYMWSVQHLHTDIVRHQRQLMVQHFKTPQHGATCLYGICNF